MSSQANKQITKNVNTTITVMLTFMAIGFVYFTFNAYEDIDKYLIFFKNVKFSSTTHKVKVLSSIILYISLLILTLQLMKFILLNLFNKPTDNPYVQTLKKLSLNQVLHLAIFIGIYSYVLFQVDLQIKVLKLIPAWFLIARLMQILGTLIQTKIIYNVRQFGIVLNTFVNIMMICQIFDYSLLNYLGK